MGVSVSLNCHIWCIPCFGVLLTQATLHLQEALVMKPKLLVSIVLSVCILVAMTSCDGGRASTPPVISTPAPSVPTITSSEPTTSATVLPSIPVTYAGLDFTYTINGDEVTIIRYIGRDSHAVIPETVAGKSISKIDEEAFSNCVLININIPDGVTSIGNGAFAGCRSLTNITVGAANSHYKDIDGALFTKDGTTLVCYPAGKHNITYPTLTGIYPPAGTYPPPDITYVIPNGVTNIGDRAFAVCYNLTSIIMPDGVTSIGNSAFSGCGSLRNITIPNSIKSIGSGAFSDCGLTDIIIPDGVVSIGSTAFRGCPCLMSVTMSSSVVSIGQMAFDLCPKLIVTCPRDSYAYQYCMENDIKLSTTELGGEFEE